MLIQIIIFLISISILSWLSSTLIKILIDMAKCLNWREYLIGFFVMAFAASLPNLFVDLPAALQHLPQISFGDIIGGNLIDLTLAMAIVVLFCRENISTESKMIQGSSLFTFLIAILPIFLIWTGKVTRIDGMVLLLAFAVYAYWLFSKDGRYKKIYETSGAVCEPQKKSVIFFKSFTKMIVIIAVLLLASQGVIRTAQFFAKDLGVSLSLVGVIIVALGNCFPETYFGIVSGRKGEGWLILGDMMGSVIVCATLVLGIIAIISPFEIKDMSPFLIARIFTVLAAIFFFIVVRTDKKITKKEGLLLLLTYVTFLITEVFVKH